MRYGRDYDHNRNWIERAGETVRGWFGGGRDYDRDYGAWSDNRDAGRGYVGRDYDRVNWTDRGNTWNTGGNPQWRGNQGGSFGWDRGGDWNRNDWGNRGSYGGERHLGTWTAGGSRGGYDSGYRGNAGRYDAEYDRDFSSRNLGNRQGGGYGSGGYRGNQGQGGTAGNGYYSGGAGFGGESSFGEWGDYNRGAYGGDLFRNSRSGGVEPGRYFRGYGIGSSGGNGYSPY